MKLSPTQFLKISRFISGKYGIKLPKGKMNMVESRLADRLKHHKFENYSEYVDFLFSSKGSHELEDIINYISTNDTWFFREKEHFEFLGQYLRMNFEGDKYRIWSSACSTGREAYSAAITIEEHNIIAKKPVNYRIVCSDISEKVLEEAKKGVYEMAFRDTLKRRNFKLYFSQLDENKFEIRKEIRDNLKFYRLNLIDPKDYASMPYKFDLIICRNVMIYFSLETQQIAMENMLKKLKPGGLFMIGHTETTVISKFPELEKIKPAIYRLKK